MSVQARGTWKVEVTSKGLSRDGENATISSIAAGIPSYNTQSKSWSCSTSLIHSSNCGMVYVLGTWTLFAVGPDGIMAHTRMECAILLNDCLPMMVTEIFSIQIPASRDGTTISVWAFHRNRTAALLWKDYVLETIALLKGKYTVDGVKEREMANHSRFRHHPGSQMVGMTWKSAPDFGTFVRGLHYWGNIWRKKFRSMFEKLILSWSAGFHSAIVS